MRRILSLLIVVLTVVNAQGQNNGVLQGEALDALNLSPLQGWTIEATHSGTSYKTTVSSGGTFEFNSLPTGLYNVHAISPKGQKQTLHEVQIRSTKPTFINITIVITLDGYRLLEEYYCHH